MLHKSCLNETMNNTEENRAPLGLHLAPCWACQGRGKFESFEGERRAVENEVSVCKSNHQTCEVGMFGAESKSVTFRVCVLNFKMLSIGSSLQSSFLWSE